MTLDELIERLEAAEGPSRELDREIAMFIEPSEFGCVPFSGRYALEGVKRSMYWVKKRRGPEDKQGKMAPHYTASIDAALTLVPEERRFNWEIEWDDEPVSHPARVWLTGYLPEGVSEDDVDAYESDVDAFGSTPALALCIASLRARG